MATASNEPGDRDPVIEAYKAHIDRSLLRENLKLTPEQRLHKLVAFVASIEELRDARRGQ